MPLPKAISFLSLLVFARLVVDILFFLVLLLYNLILEASSSFALMISLALLTFGWVQKEGGPVEEIHPGDIVWFAPKEKALARGLSYCSNESHRHTRTIEWKSWMEKVNDEQYQK